jgi:hypothetical protein
MTRLVRTLLWISSLAAVGCGVPVSQDAASKGAEAQRDSVANPNAYPPCSEKGECTPEQYGQRCVDDDYIVWQCEEHCYGDECTPQWVEIEGGYLDTWWLNGNTGWPVEVLRSNTNNGGIVDYYPWNNSWTQHWSVTASYANGRYTNLINGHSGKCMGVAGGNVYPGAPVIQWTCLPHDDQKWIRTSARGWANRSLYLGQQLCLDVPNSSTVKGQALQVFWCNGTGAQVWN